MKNIDIQIDRAKQLLEELQKYCEEDLHKKDISPCTLNLTQEVLVKMRNVIDQAMYAYFESEYIPRLTEEKVKKAKVYFPIVKDKNDLKAVLGRSSMGDLENNDPKTFKLIDSVQPYNTGYEWMEHFAKYSNEKHVRLTPQVKETAKTVHVTNRIGGGGISWGPGVHFGGCVSVMGVPIDPKTQLPVPNNSVNTTIETWVSFMFERSSVNALFLCKKAVEDGEKIILGLLDKI